MVKTILSDGNSRLIALMCSSEQDLGNIAKCFYNEFHTPRRCPYAAQYQAPQMQMQMLMITEKLEPTPRPCRVQGVNGGQPLPKGLPPTNPHRKYANNCKACLSLGKESKFRPEDICYYDFAIIGECGNVDVCLDDFLYLRRLREVESYRTYMPDDELYSIMEQWQEGGITLYLWQNSRELFHL